MTRPQLRRDDACFVDLLVKVSPRSSRNAIERKNGLVKIWVTAAPTDGQANQAVIKLLSARLDLAPSALEIIRGEAGRDKLIRISGITQQEFDHRILEV